MTKTQAPTDSANLTYPFLTDTKKLTQTTITFNLTDINWNKTQLKISLLDNTGLEHVAPPFDLVRLCVL